MVSTIVRLVLRPIPVMAVAAAALARWDAGHAIPGPAPLAGPLIDEKGQAVPFDPTITQIPVGDRV